MKFETYHTENNTEDVIEIRGGHSASFGPDSITVAADEIEVRDVHNPQGFGSESPIATKAEVSFSPDTKHLNYGDGDYKESRAKQNIGHHNAKPKEQEIKRGNPFK